MKLPSFMLIAGEPSGDLLAAELVTALNTELAAHPRASRVAPRASATFFGAGGAKMAGAGVELAFDMTQHSVIGLWEVVKRYGQFKRLFDQLVALAFERRPEVIVCVDFSGFNRRFAARIRWELQVRRATHADWKPRIVQYVSPQVWASRPGRAKSMARDFDLLLTIFPFEKQWYAERVPELKVEFVGNPAADRFKAQSSKLKAQNVPSSVLLLPGSRVGELKRHLPVMFGALETILLDKPGTRARMVLPSEPLVQLARTFTPPTGLEIQTGSLAEALAQSTLAIASTGTVTMECAILGVPTVALYKTSWSTYQIGKRIIRVKFLAMPNILANEPLYPEFIQRDATAENLARAALELLNDPARRDSIRAKLAKVVESLGEPGAARRAAQAVLALR
jgi:lipid-A-disaccharide synthase